MGKREKKCQGRGCHFRSEGQHEGLQMRKTPGERGSRQREPHVQRPWGGHVGDYLGNKEASVSEAEGGRGAFKEGEGVRLEGGKAQS